jgi:hypothetical protein
MVDKGRVDDADDPVKTKKNTGNINVFYRYNNLELVDNVLLRYTKLLFE